MPPGFISPGALLFTVLRSKLVKGLSKNIWLYPVPKSPSILNLSGAVFITRLTTPPEASASISGVNVLYTSILSTRPAGNTSRGTNLFLLSGLGILIPFIKVVLYCLSIPRMITCCASPPLVLLSTEIPETLASTFETNTSGEIAIA